MSKIEIGEDGRQYIVEDENWEDLVEFEKINDPRVLKAAPQIQKSDGPRKIRRINR